MRRKDEVGLTEKQRRFMELYARYHLEGLPIHEAKYKAYCDVYGFKRTEEYTRRLASRHYCYVSKLVPEEMLQAYGLGKDRLFQEINKRLEATKTLVSKGEIVAEVPDETVRMSATQLLADIHKMRGPQTQINVQTNKQTLIVQVMPEVEVQKYMEKVKEIQARAQEVE